MENNLMWRPNEDVIIVLCGEAGHYDHHNRIEALRKASGVERLLHGIFYLNPKRTFEEKSGVYQERKDPLYKRSLDLTKLTQWMDSKRGL
jgi:hypothetical protein